MITLQDEGRAGHLVVVSGVGEGDGQQALLLEVGLVDAGEGLDQHRASTQVARLQRGVLAAAALAVVLVADHDPLQAACLVVARNRRHRAVLTSHLRTFQSAPSMDHKMTISTCHASAQPSPVGMHTGHA